MDLFNSFSNIPLDHFSALVLAGAGIIVTVLQTRHGRRLKNIEKTSATSAAQTANSHPDNLRDDLDKKHEQVMAGLHDLKQIVQSHETRLDGLDQRMNTQSQFNLHHLEQGPK